MTLEFPNKTRSFDAIARRVRFVGHDGVMEISFAVDAAALGVFSFATSTLEFQCLAAFDAARLRVNEVARKNYLASRKSMYVLTVANFR